MWLIITNLFDIAVVFYFLYENLKLQKENQYLKSDIETMERWRKRDRKEWDELVKRSSEQRAFIRSLYSQMNWRLRKKAKEHLC